MRDKVGFGSRLYEEAISAPAAAGMTPKEEQDLRQTATQVDNYELGQAFEFADARERDAQEWEQRCFTHADEAVAPLMEMQQQVTAGAVSSAEAVQALEDAKRRLARLEQMRDELETKVNLTDYVRDNPHTFMDELYTKFPALQENRLRNALR